MSKEHLIGDWVRAVVDLSGWPGFYYRSRNHRPGRAARQTRYDRKQGHLGTRKLRRVCTRCNNEWLSDIQRAAIPILTPLIQGVWEDLSPSKAQIISTWAAMTVMNVDAAETMGGGVSPEERSYLHRESKPPDNWGIWIGRRTGGKGLGIIHCPILLGRSDASSPTDFGARNFQSMTIDIGQLLIHVVSMSPAFKRTDDVAYGIKFGVFPIFPEWGGDRLDWRTAPFLGTAEVEELAWFYLTGGGWRLIRPA